MSQITHEEARRLINFNADHALDADMRATLNAHLDDCAECRGYAIELNKIEIILRKIKHQLDLPPAPLHLDQIINQGKNKIFGFANNITVTRMAMMVLAVIVVVIGTWQFSILDAALPATLYTAIPVPTPSTSFTSTNVMFLNCSYTAYQVQSGDTLDSIASQFSIPKETIMDFNGMKEENIHPSMQIRIPICDHTPTVTMNTPANTSITITPQFKPITATPG